ncbi:competence protein ComGA [Mariprofundus micogutta]|uniref:Competence protein ComGA n=1 Tax=Mariprofundus micogutta TaxID=1921010 RepID=A0A1L8CPG6_9PROT|nr:ATPase, T2SS/T4P/T4SS family [Mariprofundus micogutta]GAV20773.1 competence protein ComGA [Mariprofundus micogutta]
MDKAKALSSRYQRVTINLINGETLEGDLLGFSPIMRRLHFHEHDQPNDVSRKLDASKIVYIGMHHGTDATPDHPSKLLHMDELKVTTVNLETFHVLASPVMSNAPGFFAIGSDGSLPYERIFFYNQGIRYQEKPERLGDLLIDQEILSAEDVQQALDKQAESMMPLGNILKEQGKLNEDQLDQALEMQQLQQMKLGDLLVDQDLITTEDVEQALEHQLGETDKPIGHILMEKGKVKDSDISSALKMQSRRKMRLGELLIEAGLIDEQDLQYALEEQKVRGSRIGEILISSQVITEDQLLSALAKKFRLPTVDLDDYDINPMAGMEIGRDVIEKFRILPVETDDHALTIALSDPMGLEAYDTISFKTGKKVHEVLAKASQLKSYLDNYLKEELVEDELACEFLHHDDQEEDEPVSELQMTQSAEDAPIVRLVNRIIRNGLHKKASDIHILPQAKKITLAYRLNGQLLSENALEKSLHKQIAARIKILCGMDISEQRLPQDGRLILRDGKQSYEFRVSCIPNSFGESLVLRVLNKDMAVELDVLGLRDDDMKQLSSMARKPYGLVLVTGPTGSGKSTTLFAVLKSISHLPAHILTIEDPVESEIQGANQIQVNHKIGMTFARILRNVLRHDPDIIMIGEMRDPETAEIGIESALTGHLMFSTLHTNSAVDTIIRLNDLGIPNYLIAPALLGVISQNLLKQLCTHCRAELDQGDPAFTVVKDLGFEVPEKLYKAVGCDHCNQTGYAGRVMSYEFLVVNERVRQAIHDGVTGQNLQKVAVESGMQPKSASALKMAAEGIIDYNDFIYSVM